MVGGDRVEWVDVNQELKLQMYCENAKKKSGGGGDGG